jgi:hypothetical protein
LCLDGDFFKILWCPQNTWWIKHVINLLTG